MAADAVEIQRSFDMSAVGVRPEMTGARQDRRCWPIADSKPPRRCRARRELTE